MSEPTNAPAQHVERPSNWTPTDDEAMALVAESRRAEIKEGVQALALAVGAATHAARSLGWTLDGLYDGYIDEETAKAERWADITALGAPLGRILAHAAAALEDLEVEERVEQRRAGQQAAAGEPNSGAQ